MGAVNRRHFAGAFVGGVAAWGVVLGFSSLYSVLNGFGPLGPYQGTGTLLGVSGSSALILGLALDLVIPVVAGLLFVVGLAILSRTTVHWLEFVTRSRAAADGALLGLIVWALFYVPVIYMLTHPTPSQFLGPLLFGLVDHPAFGAVIGLLVFAVGGPVRFRSRSEAPRPPA